MAASVVTITVRRFSVMARAKSFMSMPSTAAGPGWPTWFQTKSSPPNARAVSRTMRRASSSFVRSATIGWARPPAALISPTTRSTPAASMSTTPTAAPSLAKRTAPARPMPEAAAVTMPILPCMRMVAPPDARVSLRSSERPVDDVLAPVRWHRLGLELAAGQERVPEGVVGLVHDHALEAPDQQLALARMRHGDVGDLLRQADGEADVGAVGGMADGRAARPPLRCLPAAAVGRVELPGLAHVVNEAAGDDGVHVDGELGIGSTHLPGDADGEPRDAAQVIGLIAALGLVGVGIAGRGNVADRPEGRVGERIGPRLDGLGLKVRVGDLGHLR